MDEFDSLARDFDYFLADDNGIVFRPKIEFRTDFVTQSDSALYLSDRSG